MKVLFVCTGNTCRSPMAEGIMRHLLPEGLRSTISVGSAGTMAGDEFPPSEAACHACMVRGIDITDHRSRPLTEEVVRWADVILTMERRHLDRVRELGGGGKATLLADYPGDHGGGTEIEDPIGRGARVYEDVFEQLEKEISRVIRSLGGKGPADKRQGRGDLRSRGR